ncbi:hypothetical protein KVT40_003005 [Elsinoe batatas]|uniref:DUF7918 domain-containing protein n=1 Tax=Elsinoe batatas TaxID=2601811 RepID=A0A8K0L7Y8_9PEZI|nr:hypothetical protein KVT40_003005 [Elsinoe batatas]
MRVNELPGVKVTVENSRREPYRERRRKHTQRDSKCTIDAVAGDRFTVLLQIHESSRRQVKDFSYEVYVDGERADSRAIVNRPSVRHRTAGRYGNHHSTRQKMYFSKTAFNDEPTVNVPSSRLDKVGTIEVVLKPVQVLANIPAHATTERDRAHTSAATIGGPDHETVLDERAFKGNLVTHCASFGAVEQVSLVRPSSYDTVADESRACRFTFRYGRQKNIERQRQVKPEVVGEPAVKREPLALASGSSGDVARRIKAEDGDEDVIFLFEHKSSRRSRPAVKQETSLGVIQA